MAILVTAYKVWNLSKMFYLVNINLESTSKISLERNLKSSFNFLDMEKSLTFSWNSKNDTGEEGGVNL